MLISGNWPERALIKAQIEDAGIKVIAVDGFDAAVEWLVGGLRIDLLSLDTHGLAVDPTFVDGLRALGIPVLLITGPFDRSEWESTLHGTRIVATLVRPVFIGEVAAAIEKAAGRVGPGGADEVDGESQCRE